MHVDVLVQLGEKILLYIRAYFCVLKSWTVGSQHIWLQSSNNWIQEIFFLNVHKLWMNFINKDKQILYLTLKFQS